MAEVRKKFLPSLKEKSPMPKKLGQTKDRFTQQEKLGEGAFGEVFKCFDEVKKEVVAQKKIKLENEEEGFPSTTLREIAILQKLKHPNLVELKSIEYNILEKNLFLVFEYMEQDLRKFLDSSPSIPKSTLKKLFFQVALGVDYLHSCGVLHRDLKPQNILISGGKTIKIADFGLSRAIAFPLRTFSREIETLWYRAPEVMLGLQRYSVNVDVWSLGCLFAEIFIGLPPFISDCQIGQLYEIFNTFGTPTFDNFPGLENLKDFRAKFPKFKGKGLRQHLADLVVEQEKHYKKDRLKELLEPDAFDLLSKMLALHPSERMTARDILLHKYFDDVPNKPSHIYQIEIEL